MWSTDPSNQNPPIRGVCESADPLSHYHTTRGLHVMHLQDFPLFTGNEFTDPQFAGRLLAGELTGSRHCPRMLRPRLRAFLPATRPTSFFHFNRPVLNPQHRLPSLQWRLQWSSNFSRRIDAKYFSNATPKETPTEINEIVPPRSVGCWLLGTAGLVLGIVVVGGLTRLTESGYAVS